jgi:hypothetical protein
MYIVKSKDAVLDHSVYLRIREHDGRHYTMRYYLLGDLQQVNVSSRECQVIASDLDLDQGIQNMIDIFDSNVASDRKDYTVSDLFYRRYPSSYKEVCDKFNKLYDKTKRID